MPPRSYRASVAAVRLGDEHFFVVDDHFEADVFVPTLGVIGRL